MADEIHCELTYERYDYTPFASLSERFLQNSVTCVSPSKAFNLAGLQIANIIAADEEVRRRIDRAININEVCDVNPFGVIATMAAYNEVGNGSMPCGNICGGITNTSAAFSRNGYHNIPCCHSKELIWFG